MALTVAELIKILSEYPDDYPVEWMNVHEYGFAVYYPITKKMIAQHMNHEGLMSVVVMI